MGFSPCVDFLAGQYAASTEYDCERGHAIAAATNSNKISVAACKRWPPSRTNECWRLAADYCPRRAEGFAFAVLMSIMNLATALADNLGSYLFTHCTKVALLISRLGQERHFERASVTSAVHPTRDISLRRAG
jgi:hypothetical protein